MIGGILQETGDREDCLSEVSLLLWQKVDSFDAAKGSLSAWLTAVARNTALNHLKALRRREAHLAESEREPVSPETPEEALLRQERAERLKAVLDSLSDRERQLFYRRYYYFAAAVPDRRGDWHVGTVRGGPPLPAPSAAAAGVGR